MRRFFLSIYDNLSVKINSLFSHPRIKPVVRAIEIIASSIPIVFVLFTVGIQFTHPGYSFFQNTISELVLGPHGWSMTLMFYLLAFSLVVFVARLLSRAKNWKLRAGILMFAVMIVGVVVVGTHPTDAPGSAPTSAGVIHVITTAVLIFMFPAACFIMAPHLRSFFKKNWLTHYTRTAGALSLVFVATTAILVEANLGWVGLSERLIMFNGLAWMQVMAFLSVKPVAEIVTQDGLDERPEKVCVNKYR